VTPRIILHSTSTANEVYEGLWMGGCPPPSFPMHRHFDCLVLAAREYQVPQIFPRVRVIQANMDDDGSPMTKEEAVEAVRAAGRVIRNLNSGLRTLVTCFAGRNRSGLITALVLCKGLRMKPDQAISAIRAARGPDAFRNSYFETFLRSFCGPTSA
jgi:protein-tyrosine phosphatase